MAGKFLLMNEESDFIPLMSQDDEKRMLNETFEKEVPLLALKNTVLFPGVVLPVTAGRDKSIQLLEEAYKKDKVVAVVTQKTQVEDPTEEDLYHVGTIAKIIRKIKMPDGSSTVIIQGIRRFRLKNITQTEPYMKANIELLSDIIPENDSEFDGIIESIRDIANEIIQEDPSIPSEAAFALKNIEGNSLLVNFVVSNIQIPVEEKQEMLEMDNIKMRALDALRYLDLELQKISIKNDIQSKVRTDIDQQQREYFLNQQMRTIQEELGGISNVEEVEEFKNRAKEKKWSQETAEHFEKELARLQRMNPQVPEYSIQRNYLELFLDLPWEHYSDAYIDLTKAEKVLNKDHYGLDDIKERILEHLAVLKLKNDMNSPIICLSGPPGVGKTSLGKSIAEATGRQYIRMSLGGLHDESEIRGHRKTYIGAMPGRIIQSIKKAGTSNPVFVLDEIDKLGRGNHGDPSSALLEVLDPEQNKNFYDNYLEQGYDLSKVMFIATANTLSTIQPALLDRMEVIDISGYTVEEKVEIGVQHLLPKQLEVHGLKNGEVKIGKREMQYIITDYTRESGVRNLEKKIAKVIRHYAFLKASDKEFDPKVSKDQITEILGVPRPKENAEKFKVPGIATGLAWTRVGGDILFIESILSKGSGKFSLTGNLGEVMKESATIALEYIKANYKKLGIEEERVYQSNVHIHVPEGAVKKDGPSAGITMLTSLVSTYLNKKVKNNLAMTGEITLRGKVLPVGGIKEKLLAAKRAGIKEIILSADNQKDVEEINERYLKGVSFHYVKDMEEVIDIAIPKN